MRMPSRLFRHIAGRLLVALIGMMAVLLALLLTVELVELMRRAEGRAETGLFAMARLALLKLPEAGQMLLPFAMLFAALLVFGSLTRHRELIVARAAGLSAWRLVAPALAVALLAGGVATAMLDPLAARMLSRYEALEDEKVRGRPRQVEVGPTGLWLRLAPGGRRVILSAEAVAAEPAPPRLIRPVLFVFDRRGGPAGRIAAPSARLTEGPAGRAWVLAPGWLTRPGRPPERVGSLRLATGLDLQALADAAESARTVSFWGLPARIEALAARGLPTERLRLARGRLRARPALLAAMALLGAQFGVRALGPRPGGRMAAGALAAGAAIMTLDEGAAALALAGGLPLAAAPWLAPVVGLLAGATALLHFEDG